MASLALLDGADVVSSRTLPRDADTARGLTPALAEMLESTGWQPGDLDLVGVSIGPGSFTGLRIGVTTAKTLAYAAKTDIVAVDTLRAIATQAPEDTDAIRVVCDAGRGEAYTATYARQTGGAPVVQTELSIINRDEWLASLDPLVTQTGAALDRWCRELSDDARFAAARLTDVSCWTPTAETIGRLAIAAHATGATDDLWRLVPRYVRRSAAEEVWEARHGG
jgi:tRNA threonylcarbamoyladenosine biosynthesis protein TsaB